MSDFKFSCPACGQHLSGDARYSGMQIACPACGKPIVVPTAPSPAPIAVTTSGPVRLAGASTAARTAPPPPPPPSSLAAPAAAGPARTSGLAIASLVCSIGSFIIIPLGFIPGIICGHMAKKRIAQNPALGGAGLAKAGLIVGYVALSIQVLAMAAILAFAMFVGFKAAQQTASLPPGSPPGMRTPPRRTAPQGIPAAPARDTEPIDTTPDAAGWTLQLKDAAIPSGPVTGRIHGREFKSQKVSLEAGWLSFRQGTDFFPDLEMSVVVFINEPSALSGKTFVVPKEEFGSNPHIWMKWKRDGSNGTEQKSWMDRYALRLEFGEAAGGKIPGKIYLCVPDAEKSFIRGTFEVPLSSSPAAPQMTPPRRPKAQNKRA